MAASSRSRPSVRQMVQENVDEYHDFQRAVENFIKSHGVKVHTTEDWDFAPFHVLNARAGKPIPTQVLRLLNCAIRGRRDVVDSFTARHVDGNLDQSNILHRRFVEKLRAVRRIWFPENARDATPEASELGVKPVPALPVIPTAKRQPKTAYIAPTATDTHSLPIDQRIQLAIDSMLHRQDLDVETGELVNTPIPNAAAPSTAKSSTATTRHPVFEPLKKRREKEAAKQPARQQAAESDPEYIVISSDEEDDTDDQATRGRPELALDQDQIIPSIETGPNLAGTPTVRRSTRLNGQERMHYEPNGQWRVHFRERGHELEVWTKMGEPFLTLKSKIEAQRFPQRLLMAGETVDAWTREFGSNKKLSNVAVRTFADMGTLMV
ncbi:uncharacterized protein AB675_130 [Cyphellophora attinorum]|uniref:DUF6604 domain-containing protein n=1 Tax=Cyphellophora attinorum TaxID=1664694 RepID=A0A0N0NKF9_9EURO|nr:uncharacterized protein AB675_130 [Phialophora attinorum]KPI37799.1 hypothetical protein AB675_130 [Phialophora attinorum]